MRFVCDLKKESCLGVGVFVGKGDEEFIVGVIFLNIAFKIGFEW